MPLDREVRACYDKTIVNEIERERPMANHTALSVMAASNEFRRMAVKEALELVAKTNGQSYELALEAYLRGTPNVVEKVGNLVERAAQELADRLNRE